MWLDALENCKQAQMIAASDSTSKYLDDTLNSDSNFDGMTSEIYPNEIFLTEADYRNLIKKSQLWIYNSQIDTSLFLKGYDKRNDFYFDYVNFLLRWCHSLFISYLSVSSDFINNRIKDRIYFVNNIFM